MNLAKNLQILRKMANMTQEELAEKLSVSRQTVSKWEQGAVLPEVDKLVMICETFNCSIDQLLRENIVFSNEAYINIKIRTVEPFRYIHYAAISCAPEEDAIAHVNNWARRLKIEKPFIIGWDFPHVSQEQRNVFHMRGYEAALIVEDEMDIGDIDAQAIRQCEQRYITITLKKIAGEEFTRIPNAYKALFTHMAINGIKGRRDPSIISCFEHEYSDDEGTELMDIYVAIE